MKAFREILGKELLFADGAMGTMLQKKGLLAGEIPELWNINRPDDITAIHKSYVKSGANIITANTFGANPIKFGGDRRLLEDVIEKGIQLAKGANPNGFTALDIGPLGKLLKPFGDLCFADAYSAFSESIKIGERVGADLILIETMSDTYEAKAAVLAAKENSDLPIALSFSFDESGRLLTGGDILTAVTVFEDMGIDAIGFNCGLGPRELLPLVKKMAELTSLPIIVSPNAGLPVMVDGKTVFNVAPSEFAALQKEIFAQGTAILGGCCGSTPEHISAMTSLLKGEKIRDRAVLKTTAVSSGSKTVVFDKKPVVIGERINPTGKKRFKQALLDADIDYILREAVSEAECGADILDVNVGLPDIDEPSMMEKAVSAIQGISALPLQIDTSDTICMERALRLYNGKALVNSVNGKEESLKSVLPLVKKYGAAVVCLTLDEDGIPETSEGRIKIAERIVNRALEYGIKRENLIIDTLTMTVSTGAENAKVTLDAVDYVKNKMGLHTVLGVSNVSFGLPSRDKLNSVFFANALERGLSAGIINPLSESMMSTVRAFSALNGLDKDFFEYISCYCSFDTKAPDKKAELTLQEAVIKGLSEDAYHLSKALLSEKAPLDIINGFLVPALDVVGKGFEEGKMFLPQLLISADAAKRGFDAIREFMSEQGTKTESKGDIIIATVKGDIHDIGKNIVKVLLENYGYNVIDLGKDVPPEVIEKEAIAKNIKLVGLSALMTTTVGAMAETIRLLKKSTDCRIMVGGAVLNEDYARKIGADFYAKDALCSVRIAESVFGK